MATVPLVTNTLRCRMLFNLGGSELGGSRFFMSYTGGPAVAADLASFAHDISNQFGGHLASLMTTGYALDQVVVDDIGQSPIVRGEYSASVPGTRSGDTIAASSTVDLKFSITRPYRGGKSRCGLPFGTVTDLATPQTWNGTLTSDTASQWNAFIAALLTASYTSFIPQAQVAVSFYHGVWTTSPPWRGPGYKYPPKYKTSPITPDTITTVAADTKIGSQRRRLNL